MSQELRTEVICCNGANDVNGNDDDSYGGVGYDAAFAASAAAAVEDDDGDGDDGDVLHSEEQSQIFATHAAISVLHTFWWIDSIFL